MSNMISPRPRTVVGSGGSKRHFSIVASQFNPTYVQGLIDHAVAELRTTMPSATSGVLHVPGAFEIPVVARELAVQKRADVIIAIGVILKGETTHAENLARSVTDALQRVAIAHGVPVINAVLMFDDEDQARARCLENEINRGTEAGRAAVEISNVMARLRNK
jgi:6,7-dimethyl-8-ribityllumazine synthase